MEQMRSISTVEQVVSLLFEEKPKFHRQHGEARNWSIRKTVLEWLADNVHPHSRTLETGTGYSTVIFAAANAQHTAISPSVEEHDAIKEWCLSHKISTDGVAFHSSPSQFVLPTLEQTQLDIVLIDGAHAFPFPYIDWYYVAERLKRGGFVLLDDTQLRTVGILKDFLLTEDGRWKFVDELGKTAIFQKESEDAFSRTVDWKSQPFCISNDSAKEKDSRKKGIQQLPILSSFVTKMNRIFKSL